MDNLTGCGRLMNRITDISQVPGKGQRYIVFTFTADHICNMSVNPITVTIKLTRKRISFHGIIKFGAVGSRVDRTGIGDLVNFDIAIADKNRALGALTTQ